MQQRKAAPRQLLGAPGVPAPSHSFLGILLLQQVPLRGILFSNHLFSNHLRHDSSFWKAGHVCALASQPGKAGAAGAGKPSGDCTRACCQHKCAICPLCTAAEYLHVLQPHLQLHCRHILRVITGGCVSGLYLISKK